MTAQIVTLDLGGKHNADLEASSARILRGASWKKQRIIVVIPTSHDPKEGIDPHVVLSWMAMIFPPNNGVVRLACLGMEVGEAYSQAIENILATPDLCDWEYVLTLEHDNTPPPDGPLLLVESMDKHPEFSAIGGLYWTKGEGGCPQIWGDPKDPVLNFRPQVPVPDSIQECCGTGMGFTLFRLSMFKDPKLRRPWFKTVASAREGYGTQDLYFWGDARKHGHRCAIDTRCKVGHYDRNSRLPW